MEEVKAGRSRARTWWALAALAIVLALLGLLYLYSTGAISHAIPKGIRPPAAAVSPPDTGALFSLTVSPGRIVIPQGPTHQETAFQVSNSGGEDLDITVADLFSEQTTVVARVIMRGTQLGPLPSIPPSGKRAAVMGNEIWRVEGGRIVEHWGRFEELDLIQQLGLLPNG